MNAAKVCTNDTAMSYPLARIPYGIRRRLRELATPLEAYSLQVAGPEFKYFQPIQQCHRVKRVSFYKDFDKEIQLCSNAEAEKLDVDTCDIVTDTLYLTDLTTVDLRLLLENVRLEMDVLDMTQCEITTTFLRNVVNSLQQPVKELNIQDAVVGSVGEQSIAEIICNATSLQKLESIAVEEHIVPLSKWIDAMLEAKFTNLQYFYLSNVTPGSLDIDAETLLKFVKAQTNFCKFEIFARKFDFEVVKEQVEERFGKYFVCEADPSVFQLVLSVKEGQ